MSLTEHHPSKAIEHACEIASSYGAFQLRTIRALIQKEAPKQEVLPFVAEHLIIRPLSAYSQFVHDAFQNQ